MDLALLSRRLKLEALIYFVLSVLLAKSMHNLPFKYVGVEVLSRDTDNPSMVAILEHAI